jgi:hypothetical protein
MILSKFTAFRTEVKKKFEKIETVKPPDMIMLNIGGTVFIASKSTVVKEDNSMLAAMFSGRYL